MYQPSIVLWTVYIALILSGLFLKRSRVYDVAVIIFMGILALLNTKAADLQNIYMPIYSNPDLYVATMDPGWIFLCKIGSLLGLSYNGFACIVAMIATAIFAYYGRRATPNESFFLALFLVYPGLMSLVQFRQFVASAVALIAVLELSKGGKRGWISFVIAILLAFSFHRSAIIVGTVALMPLFTKFGKRGRFLAIGIALIILVYVTVHAVSLSNFFFGDYRTSVYLGETSVDNRENSFFGGLRNAAYTVGLCLFVPYCSKLMLADGGEQKRRLLNLISFANISIVAVLPFLFITNDFMRFERYAFSLGLTVFAGMPYIRNRHVLFSCKAFLLFVCFLFCYSLVIKGTFDSVIGALLSFDYVPSFFV